MENSSSSSSSTGPHLALFPSLGIGHLNPFTELAKLLVDRHGFTVTIVLFSESWNPAQEALLSSLPPSITYLTLPPIPLSDIPRDSRPETLISASSSRCVPSVRSLLHTLQSSTNLVAFVVDFLNAPACDVAKQLSLPCYVFMPITLHFCTLLLHLPTIDAGLTCDFWELDLPVCLPGCLPIPGPDIPSPLQDRKSDFYKWLLQHIKHFREAGGILMNTFDAVEPEASRLLKGEKESGAPMIYTVGPIIRSAAENGDRSHPLFEWLDLQPERSVIFVSFGSGGTLSADQLAELAMGLEDSRQRFLWVVRSPIGGSASGAYFTAGSEDDPLAYLPQGFLERTKGVGLVVPSWGPQVEILAHPATGGFLSHCGWNSTLESVTHGVPMIGWPLYAEQRMNAVLLAEGVKVMLRMKAREDGLFDRTEIARAVRELMEGEEGKQARKKARELQQEAAAALAEGGTSTTALAAVADRWKRV